MDRAPGTLRRWLLREGRPPRSPWIWFAWLAAGGALLLFLVARREWPASDTQISDPSHHLTVRYAFDGPGAAIATLRTASGHRSFKFLGTPYANRVLAVDDFLGSTGEACHVSVYSVRFSVQGQRHHEVTWTSTAGHDFRLRVASDGSISTSEGSSRDHEGQPMFSWTTECELPVCLCWNLPADSKWSPSDGEPVPSNAFYLTQGNMGGMGVPVGQTAHADVWLPDDTTPHDVDFTADVATPALVQLGPDGSLAVRPASGWDRFLHMVAWR